MAPPNMQVFANWQATSPLLVIRTQAPLSLISDSSYHAHQSINQARFPVLPVLRDHTRDRSSSSSLSPTLTEIHSPIRPSLAHHTHPNNVNCDGNRRRRTNPSPALHCNAINGVIDAELAIIPRRHRLSVQPTS